MAWGSWSSTQTTKVWSTTTGWDSSEQFAVLAKWRYRSNAETNQTQIILDTLTFRETRQLCLAYCTCTFQGGFSGSTTTGSVTLTQKNSSGGTASLPYDASVTINQTKTFNNDSNGYATGLYFYWRCYVNSSDYRVPKQSSLSTYNIASSTIPKLALKSTLAAVSGTIGSACTLSVTRQNSSYTHTITYSYGSYSGTICTKSSSTSISWTPPMTLCNATPSATSGTGSLTITTYSGSTSLGSNTATLMLSVPSSVVPSISSVTITENNSTCKNLGLYVASKSSLTFATSASGSYSSSISSVQVTFVGKTWTGTSITTGTFSNSGTQTATIKVTDSRGRTASTTRSLTILAYTAPKITSCSIERCDEEGNLSDEGTYALFKYTYSITALNNKNTKTVSYRRMTSGTSSYTTLSSATLDSYSGTNTTAVVGSGAFDISTGYSLQLAITDAFGTSTSSGLLTSSYTLMNFGANGESLSLMKASANRGHFEVNMPTELIGGSYVHAVSSGTDETGYIKFMKIEIITNYANSPIIFDVMQRNMASSTRVAIKFANENNLDPALSTFYRMDDFCKPIYLYKESTGTWVVYIQKSENWENMSVTNLNMGAYGHNHFKITWLDEVVTSLPSGYITATNYLESYIKKVVG